MKLQDGELVRWIGDNGGWCMGHVQTTADGRAVEAGLGVTHRDRLAAERYLVKHTLSGELEFVANEKLERHPPRSELKEHAEPTP